MAPERNAGNKKIEHEKTSNQFLLTVENFILNDL